jgi:phage shock protein A
MANVFTRIWKYLGAALTGKFDEMADPKVQIDQAIAEAQEQHRSLRERAADVIASQKQTQMQLERAEANLDKTRASAKQALVMAEEATAAGDTDRAAKMTTAAENFAQRLVILEDEVTTLQKLLLQASAASDQAKAAVSQNASLLQRKMQERQTLLNQLGQAKMAEQMNTSMESLTASVGQDVPTLDEVRAKIEGRLARAQGRSELAADSVEGQMLEVEQAAMNSEARARLSQLRSELGIAGTPAAGAADKDAIEAEIDAAVAEAQRQEGEGAG